MDNLSFMCHGIFQSEYSFPTKAPVLNITIPSTVTQSPVSKAVILVTKNVPNTPPNYASQELTGTPSAVISPTLFAPLDLSATPDDSTPPIARFSSTSQIVQTAQTPPTQTNEPLFSNGNKLNFTSERDGNSEVYITGMKNDVTEECLTHDPGKDSRAAVSPDGQKIAFASARSGHMDII